MVYATSILAALGLGGAVVYIKRRRDKMKEETEVSRKISSIDQYV